jgi:hypothetical protein
VVTPRSKDLSIGYDMKYALRIVASGFLIMAGFEIMNLNAALYVTGILFLTAEIGDWMIDD